LGLQPALSITIQSGGEVVMIKPRLIIGILTIAAIVIIAMAVFIVTHFSSMSPFEELVLIGIGVVMLFIVMGVLFMIVRFTSKK
jgi:hypothetical protein